LFGDLFGRELVQARDGVIVVKLHAVESQFLVELQFLAEGDASSHGGPERIATFMNVPWSE